MLQSENASYVEAYKSFLHRKEYPCVAAKAAIQKQQVHVLVVDHMACPKDDRIILDFIYNFVDKYRSADNLFHSVAIIFKGPEIVSEEEFEKMLWDRLQSLANIGNKEYGYDKRVSNDPQASNFSFSIKEEAFYIIGLHPNSNRAARRFKYPTLVFNPHQQFEELRKTDSYEKMKKIVRKLDTSYSGSVNPMLQDFGKFSEAMQYSGRKLDETWQCPFKNNQ